MVRLEILNSAFASRIADATAEVRFLRATTSVAAPFRNTAQVCAMDQLDLDSTPCNGNAAVATLAEILAPYRAGDKPITVTYRSESFAGDIELSDEWRVNLDDALIDRLREWLAPENVEVLY